MSKLLSVSGRILTGFVILHSLLSHFQRLSQSTQLPLQLQISGLLRCSSSYEVPTSYPCQGQKHRFEIYKNSLNLLAAIQKGCQYVDEFVKRLIPVLPGAAAQDVYMTGYFDGACPDGWEIDEEASGRLFISGTKQEGEIGNKGGSEEVTLSADQMPIHTHKILAPKSDPEAYKNIQDATFIVEEANRGVNTPDDLISASHQYQLMGSDDLPLFGQVSFAGGGRAHNNLPPYIKRMVCKIKSSDFISRTSLDELQATIQTAMDDQKTELEGKITDLDDKIAAAAADTDRKMKELQQNLNDRLQEHKDEMNKKFEDYKKEMLPFHILACVSFGCFILSIIFWLVILKKVKTPEYNSKVLYSPRTTRP